MSIKTHTHRFIPSPTKADRTLLLLHGTGGDENDLIDLGRQLDPDAAILSPRGNVSENGMPRFFRRLAEGVFDLEDVNRRANELADFVTAAAGHYTLSPDNIVAVGFSNGANIAAAMMLLRPEILHGAILLRAMVTIEPDASPDLSGKRVLMSSGEADPIIPLENAERLAAMLRAAGADVTFKVQHAGHNLTRQDLIDAQSWLRAL